MHDKKLLTLTVISALLLAGAFSAIAYTSFSAERTASIDVVADDSGIVILEDDADSDIVHQDTNGEIDIDVGAAGASGVNVESTMWIGNNASGSEETQFAFSFSNGAGSAKDISLNYVTSGGTASNEVMFNVYDSNGTFNQWFSEEDGEVTFTSMNSGDTKWVIIEVNTTGLTSSDDLSGTLYVNSSA